jgi:hypothetical protein
MPTWMVIWMWWWQRTSYRAQTPQAFLIENVGGGAFAPPILLGDAEAFLMVCLVVDVNDDGLLDHVGDIGGTIGVTINAGGTFDAPILFDGTYGRPAHISDLNGDGLLDMIADAGGSLIIWHATAPFVFEVAQTVALPGGMEYADLRDIDGDGRCGSGASRPTNRSFCSVVRPMGCSVKRPWCGTLISASASLHSQRQAM